ncbi:hypothetical protein CDEST_06214 [Colletotrichum destructivum]|uniref:Uncharacterized protein n=1 Tax=Colletotrichum destructivum TaxID=34406 RepID=A0AAX4ID75_9PEZI|nr:hypothetical protein CDEST_06214 [Colletotrichum destructivum]
MSNGRPELLESACVADFKKQAIIPISQYYAVFRFTRDTSTNASTDSVTSGSSPCFPLLILTFFRPRKPNCRIIPKRPFEWSSERVAREFVSRSRAMFYHSTKDLLGEPFRVFSDLGDVIILPPDAGQEIRNYKRSSFAQGLMEAKFQKPACDPSKRLQNVVKTRLTKTLEWHDITLKQVIFKIVSSMSSKIFVSKHLGRIEKWL